MLKISRESEVNLINVLILFLSIMKIFIITPFPEVVDSFMRNSIIKKAQDNNLINYETLDLFE